MTAAVDDDLVAQSDGSEVSDGADGGAKAQGSRRARARAAGSYLLAALTAWWVRHRTPTDEESRAPRVHRSSVWSQAPASITDLLAYTRSGAWVPGDRHPLLEGIGKAYGYGVAVPCSAALYGVAFVLQRPVRLLTVVAFLVLLAVSL